MGADGGTTTTVRLSLLRAPRFPDPETGQGLHRFGYALVPGASIGDAVREGFAINLPDHRPPGTRETVHSALAVHSGRASGSVRGTATVTRSPCGGFCS